MQIFTFWLQQPINALDPVMPQKMHSRIKFHEHTFPVTVQVHVTQNTNVNQS